MSIRDHDEAIKRMLIANDGPFETHVSFGNMGPLAHACDLCLFQYTSDQRKYKMTERGDVASLQGTPAFVLAMYLRKNGETSIKDLQNSPFADWCRLDRKFANAWGIRKDWFEFHDGIYRIVNCPRRADDLLPPDLLHLRKTDKKLFKDLVQHDFLEVKVSLKPTIIGKELAKLFRENPALDFETVYREIMLEMFMQTATRPDQVKFLLQKGTSPSRNHFGRLPWRTLLGDHPYEKCRALKTAKKDMKVSEILKLLLENSMNVNEVPTTLTGRSGANRRPPMSFFKHMLFAYFKKHHVDSVDVDLAVELVTGISRSLNPSVGLQLALQYGGDVFSFEQKLNLRNILNTPCAQLLCKTFVALGLEPHNIFAQPSLLSPIFVEYLEQGYIAKFAIDKQTVASAKVLFIEMGQGSNNRRGKTFLCQMSEDLFEEICQFVGPTIMYTNSIWRKSGVPPQILHLPEVF